MRVEIDRKGRDQRLAFAGLHFGNLALVKDHAADQLNVEMTLTKRALRGFADSGEGWHQKLIERDAFGDPLSEFFGAGLQRIIGQRLEFLFELIDLADPGRIAANAPLVGGSKQFAGDGADHTGAPNVGRGLYHAATTGFASGTPECGTFRANSTLNAAAVSEWPKPCERYEGVGLLSIGDMTMT